jgi:hypothetical protein
MNHIEPPTAGPSACWRSKNVSAPCDKCGAKSEVCHMPTHERGFYCAAHCPVCAIEAVGSPQQQGAAIPLPQAGGAVLAGVGAKGGGFNRPFGKRYEKYLEG